MIKNELLKKIFRGLIKKNFYVFFLQIFLLSSLTLFSQEELVEQKKTANENTQGIRIELKGIRDFSQYTAFIKDQGISLVPNKEGLLIEISTSTSDLDLSDGNYELILLKKDTEGKVVQKSYPIFVNKEKSNIISIEIKTSDEDSSKYLRKIIVTSEKKSKSPTSATKKYLDANLARLTPGTGGEIINAVKNYPGISGGHKEIIVRGSDSSDVLYFFDGVPILSPYHSFSFNSIFPLNIIDNLEFYPGAFPIQYGESQGSLLEFKPKKIANSNKFSLRFNINPVSSDGSIYLPIGNHFSISASGRLSYYNTILNQLNEIYDVTPDAPSSPALNIAFYDYFAALEYRIDEQNNLYFWLSSAGDEFKHNSTFRTDKNEDIPDVISTQYAPRDEVGRNTIKSDKKIDELWNAYALSYEINNNTFNNKISLSYLTKQEDGINDERRETRIKTNYSLVFSGSTNVQKSSYKITDRNLTLKNEIYYVFVEDFFTLGGGVHYNQLEQSVFIDYLRDVSKYNEPFNETQLSTFVNGEFLTGNFIFNIGLRGIDLVQNTALDIRGNAIYNLNKKWNFYLSAGKYTDYQDFFYVNNTFESIFKTSILPQINITQDQAIKPFGIHYGAGFKGKFYDQNLTADIYYKDLYNQRVSVDYDIDLQVLEENFIYLGRGRSYGIEYTMQNKVTKIFTYTLGYSFSISEREVFSIEETSKALDEEGGDFDGVDYENLNRYWKPFDEDITHNINVTLAWNMNKRSRWSVSYKGFSGKPYTPHTIVRPGNHILGFLSKVHSDIDSYNNSRLPFTHNLSLRFDYISNNFIFYVDILNIDTLIAKRILTYNPNGSLKIGELLENSDLTIENAGVVNAFTIIAPLFGFEFIF